VGRRFDFAPLCYCGEKAIMRTAKNKGENFGDAQSSRYEIWK